MRCGFQKTLCIIFCVFMGIVFYKNYFVGKTVTEILYAVLIMLIAFAASTFFVLHSNYSLHFQKEKFKKQLLIANAVLLTVQIFITVIMYYQPNYDARFLMESSTGVALGEDISQYIGYYFFSYNNAVIFCVLIWLKKIALWIGFSNLQLFVSLFATLISNASCYFLALCVDRLTPRKELIWLAWIVYAFYVVISLWAIETYTNAYSLLFPVLILYLYLSRNDPGNSYTKNIILIAVVSVIGYWIKPTNIIISIAILILAIYKIISNSSLLKFDFKRLQKIIIAIICSNAVILSLCIITLKGNVVFFSQYNIPTSHYFMMGLNDQTTGSFSEEDNSYTLSFNTKSEREHADSIIIKQRLNSFGFSGYISFLCRKLALNYSYFGTFVTEDDILSNSSSMKNSLAQFYLGSSNKGDSIYLTISAYMWLYILSLFTISVFPRYSDDYFLIVFTIFGLTIFLLLFEAGSRQLIISDSYFCIGAMIGFDKLLNVFIELGSKKK